MIVALLMLGSVMEKIRSSGFARATILSYTSILRTFFRFAGRQGWCCPRLAAAIHSPRIYRQETLPSCPSWDDVQRLLATTEGDRPTDIRDRAILMLLAIYGLRAGEVVRLRLEDFDWEQERLHVLRPKANRAQIYPLSRSVGNAVLRYLKEVRPRSSLREVFLTRRVPYRLLSAKAVWPIVSCRFDALGVSLPHQGPHSLRHACATHLLEQGLSLKEIADHLGHLHPVTTQIYTKVDLARLRKVGEFDMGGLL
jgi:integrase/recombinase XerD